MIFRPVGDAIDEQSGSPSKRIPSMCRCNAVEIRPDNSQARFFTTITNPVGAPPSLVDTVAPQWPPAPSAEGGSFRGSDCRADGEKYPGRA